MPMFGSSGPIPVNQDAAAYQPGILRTGLQMLFDGSSPADAAEHLRQIQYQQALRPIQAKAFQDYLGNFAGSGDQAQPQVQPGEVIQGNTQADTLPAPQPTTIPEAMGAGLGGALGGTIVAPQSGRLVPQAGQPEPRAAAPTARPYDPYDLSDPRARRILGGGAVLGMPGNAQQLEIAKAAQPHITNVNGWAINDKDGSNAGRYFAEAPVKGASPLFDEDHNQVGWRMQDGSIQAIQATKQAEALGQTLGSPVTVPRGDGSTQLMLGGDYFGQGGGSSPAPVAPGGPLVAQRGGQPGSAPSQLGVSQTPGARAAAEASGSAEGAAGAKARIDYPSVLQRATQSIDLIDGLIKDPHLKDRLGWGSKLPPWPGGHGPGIEAKLDQLGGTVFLQAYNDLKGAGSITEIEGAKAEGAIARLKRHDQSYEDYVAALNDLRSVIATGIGRAQERTKFGQQGGGAPARQATPDAVNYLRANPSLAAAYDAKYGAGASRAVLGR